MKVVRTPAENCFKGGWVKFSRNRKDSELYYEIFKSNESNSDLIRVEFGKVKDEAHLKELECMEKEIEN